MNVHAALLTMVTKSFGLFPSHNYVITPKDLLYRLHKSNQCFYVALQPQVTNKCHRKKSNLNILLNISFCVEDNIIRVWKQNDQFSYLTSSNIHSMKQFTFDFI